MEKRASPGMERLSFLIGKWHTTGDVKGDEDTPASSLSGIDTYEWILDRTFILHRVDVRIGEERVEAIEVIGPSAGGGVSYSFRSFDNGGVFTEMEAHIDEDGALHIVGDKMRATLTMADRNTLTAHWENSEDNEEWMPWMELTLSR